MARFALAVLLLTGSLLAGSPASAKDMAPFMGDAPFMEKGLMTRMPMHGSCPTPGLILDSRDAIGISDSQTTELRALEFSLKKQQILMGAKVKALELELTGIVTDPGFKEGAALDKLAEIERARTELRSEVIKASARARDLLDDEQRARLGEVLADMLDGRRRKAPGQPARSKGMDKDMMKERMMKEMMQEKMQEKMP